MADSTGTEMLESTSNKLHHARDGTEETTTADDEDGTGEEVTRMKDLESIKDIFKAAVIPDDIFYMSAAILCLESALLLICFSYTDPAVNQTDNFSTFTVCAYAAIAAVSEAFDDFQTIVIGFNAIKLSKKHSIAAGSALNSRRLWIGALQVGTLCIMFFVMILIVPLQGGPVDIILNATAFLSIMQLDVQVLKYMGFRYIVDNDIAKYHAEVELMFKPRQKKILLVCTLATFGSMIVIAQTSQKVLQDS
jgi:hypothetical protein